MASALDATELHAFVRLENGITGADVHQHAPDNAPAPLVIVGDIEGFPITAGEDPDRRVSVTIVVITEGEERSPCTLLTDQVEKLLSDVAGDVGGFRVTLSLESTTAQLSPDGFNYVGIVKFTGFALAA